VSDEGIFNRGIVLHIFRMVTRNIDVCFHEELSAREVARGGLHVLPAFDLGPDTKFDKHFRGRHGLERELWAAA